MMHIDRDFPITHRVLCTQELNRRLWMIYEMALRAAERAERAELVRAEPSIQPTVGASVETADGAGLSHRR